MQANKLASEATRRVAAPEFAEAFFRLILLKYEYESQSVMVSYHADLVDVAV